MQGMMMMMVVVVVSLLLTTLFQFSSAGFSTIVLPLSGNFYPTKAYLTTIRIGDSAKHFELQMAPGSDLTWVKCAKPSDDPNRNQHDRNLYIPREENIIHCGHPLCAAVQGDQHHCKNPNDRCQYVIRYGDGSSTHGYLVEDTFHLQHTIGLTVPTPLVFGCGYRQKGSFKWDGVLGLSKAPVGFLSQMHKHKLIEGVFGHCFSEGGGGFLFLGDKFTYHIQSWATITDDSDKAFILEPTDLLFDGKSIEVKDLKLDFDAGGNGLLYFKHPAYPKILHMISNAVNWRTPLVLANPEVKFPICWEHKQESITTLNDVRKYFKNITFKFKDARVELNLPPQAYLVLTQGKVCLGILDGNRAGLKNHLIGAIAMQDKLVVYDWFTNQIGWASHNCNMPH